MPTIYDYHCDTDRCLFSGPTGWGYYAYVEDDDGTRIACPHPGERTTARSVLGDDATEEEIDERMGCAYHCVCLACVALFDADPERDTLTCPDCGADDVATLVDLVGESCPECEDGTIVAEETGMIS